jgi:hypothetical protein
MNLSIDYNNPNMFNSMKLPLNMNMPMPMNMNMPMNFLINNNNNNNQMNNSTNILNNLGPSSNRTYGYNEYQNLNMPNGKVNFNQKSSKPE